MDLPITQPPAAEPPAGAPRFTYVSGSQPLDGYTIKRGIGRGGFGEVYYAVSHGGKEVALKLIRRNLDVELRGVRQCLNLKHPHLLSIHDIRVDGQDDRWVVMEYISGESLQDVIERNPNGMPVAEILTWIRGIAAGVAYLHDHGIVHRDLKPGNIFMDEGVVKIGDYGLAKFVSCSRRSGQTESVGTVHYMAPEIANGRYGKEIDIYALGVMLYEMLTGRVPFEGESVGEVLMKHLTAQPNLNLLKEPFRSIVGRALAKDPDARFGSVAEMLARLPPSLGEGSVGMARGAIAGDEAFVDRVEVVGEEEPIWRLVRGACQQLNELWIDAHLHPATRIALVLAGVLVLASSTRIWLPPLFTAILVYGVYRAIRAVVLASRAPQGRAYRQEPARAAARPPDLVSDVRLVDEPERPNRRVRRRYGWPRDPNDRRLAKPPRQRLTELTGSMLIAAGVAVTMSLVMMILYREPMRPEQFAWLSIMGTVGAWVVMIPAKFWEGLAGEQAPRRFIMLIAGLVLGAMACALAGFLSVDLTYDSSFQSPLRERLPYGFYYDVNGTPQWPAYLAYFGFVLLAVRWWRQADPARNTRLSLVSCACVLFAAWLANLFWPFPQPWGIMAAVVMAVSVQLASPRLPARKH